MKYITLDPERQPYCVAYLQVALEMEKKKLDSVPVIRDKAPGYTDAMAWGYVVAGYFLLEQALKFLISVRGEPFPATHSLSLIFGHLSNRDREVLQEYYRDFCCSYEKARDFPIPELEIFVKNMDVEENAEKGPLAWRYFLIQKPEVDALPIVSAELMHEVTYGAIRSAEILMEESSIDPRRFTYSCRMRDKLMKNYMMHLNERMNSEGWKTLGDRVEIVWGPDSCARYDYLVFKGKNVKKLFGKIPQDYELPVMDMRAKTSVLNAP